MESDAELLSAINEDRPGAFDAFVERYGRRLFAFGLQMCRQRQDAEDVFQETLLKAYQSLAQLKDPGAMRTWLFRVAANQCLMKRRKTPTHRELPLELRKPEGFEAPAPIEIPDLASWPDAEAARVELHEALEAALQSLPPEARIVVLLRDVEGLSTREVAEALDLGPSAVKMRLHRARAALRRHLEAFHGASEATLRERGDRAEPAAATLRPHGRPPDSG